MNTRFKKGLIIGIGVIIFILFSAFGLNYFVENKLKNTLEDLPDTLKLQYKSLSVNFVSGKVELEKPVIYIYEKTTNNMNAQIEIEKLNLDGFGYIDYLFYDKFFLADIIINQPKIKYFHNNEAKSKSYGNSFIKELEQAVEIESIQINNGAIEVYEVGRDSLLLKSAAVNLGISAIEINHSNVNNPVTYKDFTATCNNLFYKLNLYDDLFLEYAEFKPIASKVSGFSIKTKGTKQALSKLISFERDHIDLEIDSIVIKNQDFGFKQDSIFYFKSERVDFHTPTFQVYRDKLVADDFSYKSLYGKSLRDLNFNLTLNAVFVNNASIIYTEKVKVGSEGGTLLFSKLNAEIKNLSNTYTVGGTMTSANIKTVFMDYSPINIQWDFDVQNRNDAFVFKTEIGKLNADSMNQFLEPNLNVRLEGELNKTYFTIDGNEHTSHIDLKLEYDNFNVVILKKNGVEKNKLISTIVNLFVSKSSKYSSGSYRYGSKSDIEREKNKSIYNYLWINLKSGLQNAMTSNGKK